MERTPLSAAALAVVGAGDSRPRETLPPLPKSSLLSSMPTAHSFSWLSSPSNILVSTPPPPRPSSCDDGLSPPKQPSMPLDTDDVLDAAECKPLSSPSAAPTPYRMSMMLVVVVLLLLTLLLLLLPPPLLPLPLSWPTRRSFTGAMDVAICSSRRIS